MRSSKPVRFFLAVICFSLSLFASFNALAEADVPRVPNLRAFRDPQRPWTVQDGQVRAQVSASNTEVSLQGAKWNIVAHVHVPGEFISARITTPSFQVDSISHAGSSRRVIVSGMAPLSCYATQAREMTILEVVYRQGEVSKTARLAIDYRCLLGHLLSASDDIASLAKEAEKYKQDPLIRQLVASAPKHKQSLQAEVAYLRNALHYGKDSFRRDPPAITKGWVYGIPYGLNPTETARFGGKCADWTNLICAYLTLRGFHVSIGYAPGHVWTIVHLPEGDQTVDWVGQPSANGPTIAVAVK